MITLVLRNAEPTVDCQVPLQITTIYGILINKIAKPKTQRCYFILFNFAFSIVVLISFGL